MTETTNTPPPDGPTGRIEPVELQRRGFRLYERFRPGESGWGAKGELVLAKVRAAAG